MDGILVTEPIGTLDSIIHVPSPVILVHVTQSSVDTTLSSDGVTSCGEELGDTGCVEASLGKTEGGTKTGTTSTDDEGIVLVILNQELISYCVLDGLVFRIAREDKAKGSDIR